MATATILATKMYNQNSVSVPPWRKILIESSANAMQSTWREYVHEGETLAKCSSQFNFFKTIITTRGDIEDGEELTRSYGHEWLGMKYYHLLSNLLLFQKDGIATAYVNMNTLEIQSLRSKKEKESFDGIPAYLKMNHTSMDLVAASLSDLEKWAKDIKFLAETVGGLGRGINQMLDIQWEGILMNLKAEKMSLGY